MNKFYFPKILGYALFSFSVILTSCKSEAPTPEKDEETSSIPSLLTSTTVNWNARPDGAYSTADANSDLGSLTGWKESRTYISNQTLRLKVEKNALSSSGGIVANIDIPDGNEYEVQFKVKFHSEFDWGKGGKVGFGFRIGDGNTGCDKADDGNGGSARMMWYTSANGNVRFKPYLYYKDMPDDCGSGFDTSYPTSGSLEKGIWYTVKIYVKSNTGSDNNGLVKFTVNNTVVLDRTIRWTTNTTKRLINQLAFSTFRGGSTSDWESSTDGYIYFDDLTWTKIN